MGAAIRNGPFEAALIQQVERNAPAMHFAPGSLLLDEIFAKHHVVVACWLGDATTGRLDVLTIPGRAAAARNEDGWGFSNFVAVPRLSEADAVALRDWYAPEPLKEAEEPMRPKLSLVWNADRV